MAKEKEKEYTVPRHVAIIMDGNGRWAKKRLLPRKAGHVQGSRVAEQICEDAYNLGIEYLTIYAFSTENWARPKDEVDALMNLLRKYMKDSIERSSKNNMRVRVIGDISALDQDLQDSIRKLEEVSASNTGLKFQVAINYGGRDEILRAVRKVAEGVKEGTIEPDKINEEMFYSFFDTAGIPYPDFNKKELQKAIDFYNGRERRFGGI